MPLQVTRRWNLVIILGLILTLLLTGCSNPLADDEDPADNAADAEATATAPPPMPIITPTVTDPTAVAAASPTDGSGERPETYVVAENDTLYGIAARFSVEISTLVEANGLSDPNDIWVGQELTIPPLD